MTLSYARDHSRRLDWPVFAKTNAVRQMGQSSPWQVSLTNRRHFAVLIKIAERLVRAVSSNPVGMSLIL